MALLLCVGSLVRADAGSAAATARARHVPWVEDVTWSTILAEAALRDAPVFIDFYATWCKPCKLLDAMVYNEKEVIAELADVVTFKVDVDKPEYFSLKKRFGIDVLPTLIWCDSNGREIDRFTGYRSSTEFLELVRAFRSGADTFLAVQRGYAADPGNAELMLDLARRYRIRGSDTQARVLYMRLMNLREQVDPLTTAAGMLELAEMELEEGRRDQTLELAHRAGGLFSERDPGFVVGMCRVADFQGAAGDTLGMLETYRNLVALDDQNVDALVGFARAALLANREFEEATRLALRAVLISEMDPAITETLAETYYRRGLYRRAIRWIDQSIERDPQVAYYREQRVRFQDALTADPYGFHGARR